MNSEPRILVLEPGYQVSALVEDIRESLSDSVVIDARASDLLKNETDLRLVVHYARDEGKRITIVTRDPALTALAAQLDVEVLSEMPGGEAVESPGDSSTPSESVDRNEVPEATAGNRPRRARILGIPTKVLAPVAALVVAAVSIGAVIVSGMRVEVTVVPATAEISESVMISTNPGGTRSEELAAALGITVPSEVLSVDVEYSTEIPTTGEHREGIAPSVGEVLFINSGATPVKVPARTKLLTADGIEFETVNDAEVAPKTITTRAGLKISETNGTALVAATACSPGSTGNTPPVSIVAIDGPLSGRLQVTNENEFRGGRDRVTRVVSESDVAELNTMCERWMLEEGASQLRKAAGFDRYLLLPTLELNLRSSRIYPDVGRESDRVSIDAAGTVELESVRFEDLCAAIGDKLSVAMDDGYRLVTDSLQIDSLSCAKLSSGAVAISVDVSAQFVADVDLQAVATLLSGESLEQARQKLLDSGKIAGLTTDRPISRFPRWSGLIDVVVSNPEITQVGQEIDSGGV